MAIASSQSVLRTPLRSAWMHIRKAWFENEGTDQASADDVRKAVSAWLDENRSANTSLMRLWDPLSAAKKQEALTIAFPDRSYDNGTEEEREYVIERLKEYEGKFNEILELIGDRQSLTAVQKKNIQTLLRDLKTELDLDCDDEKKRKDVISDHERKFFYPAVRQASAHITVRVNTDPIKSNWPSILYGARIDITHMLAQLRSLARKS